MNKIKCKYCDTMFVPYRKTSILCRSKDCRRQYNKEFNATKVNIPKNREENSNKMATWRQKNPAKRILSNLKQRNNIDIDEAWIQKRLDSGVCEATGIKFKSPERYGQKVGFNHYPWTPSVDKINPNGGYRKSNCRLVVWSFNRAKGLWGDDIVVQLSKGVMNGIGRL